MPSLPASSSFTGGTVTEGQFKAAITALRDYLAALLGADGTATTALATLGAPFSSTANKTAAYTVTLSDRGRLITASGTGAWTLALPAVGIAGAGFMVGLRNGSTGNITIDPSGAELVNGLATLVVGPGGDAVAVCTGSEWVVVGSTGNDPLSLPVGTLLDLSLRFLTRPGVGLYSPAANVLALVANSVERMRITTAGAQITGLLSGTAVTQSATDNTTGRLLKVGDFGIGSSTATPSTLAAAVVGGLYNYQGTDPDNPFPSAGGAVFVERQTSLVVTQTARRSNTFDHAIRYSGDSGTTWSAWARVYNARTIVGTVSQASGIPTGALFETNSNANGRYLRLPDGTQICWRTMAASASAGVVWTFPAAFIDPPVVTGSAVATVLSSVQPDADPTATTATLSARDKTDARRADVMHLTAIGRWF